MGNIQEDLKDAREWLVEALSYSGYKADYSPESLWEIDRFFDEQAKDGKANPGGLLSQDLGSRLFAIGSYVGEVIRKARGGEWVGDDTDPKVELNIELHLPDGTKCWPVQRVMKRFKNGPEDGIAVYGQGAGLAIGPKPPPPSKKPWWKLWK